MPQLTIKNKMLIIGSALFMVLVIQISLNLTGTNNIKHSIAELQRYDIKMLELSKDIKFSVAQVQQWITDISATRGLDGLNDGLEIAEKNAKRFFNLIQQLIDLDPQNAENYQQISKAFKLFYASGKLMADAYINGSTAEGNKLMAQFDVTAANMLSKIDPFLIRITKNTNSAVIAAQGKADKLNTIIMLSSLVSIFVLLFAVITVRGSLQSLEQLGENIWHIADGDGDLTRQVTLKGKDEVAHIAEGFNKFIASIREIVITIGNTSTQLSQNSETSSGIMSKTSQDITQQKDDIMSVSAAIHQVSATGKQTSSSANEAATAANTAQGAAINGQQAVENVVLSINGLASEVDTASNVIDRLGDNSNEIGSILDVIKGIAEQTNLLALNAAIEAARAGEQGRGFAVVADEVRTLATRTQESTSEIETTIEKLQHGTKEAAKVMETSRKIAQTTVDKAGDAKEQLYTIVNEVGTINDINSQISHATQEQNQMILTMLENIEGINQMAEKTSDGASQTASMNQDLLMLSHQLCNSIKGLKT